MNYDLVVIGGGPGGYVAAIKAAKMSMKTCIVECTHLGGTCLNEGCIPAKTLIKTVSVLEDIKHAAEYGINGVDADQLSVSMKKLQARKQNVVRQLVGGVEGLLAGNKVTIERGRAAFIDKNTVKINNKTITAKYLIIATGSESLIPGFIQYEGTNHIITSKEALELENIPGTITIIGGGVIGVEFAYIFSHLGSNVTVVELTEQILPVVDTEIAVMAKKALEKSGVKFLLGSAVKKIADNEVIFERNGKTESLKSEVILMAVGRKPFIEGLNCEMIGLEIEKGAIKTNLHMCTNIPNIYAIGDVNGKAMLAHTASHEGIVAARAMNGEDVRMDYGRIPSCVYLDPEIAAVGITEKQAREKYEDVKVGVFNMSDNGKSLVEGDTSGRIKVILEGSTGEILGVHMYCKHATDMISEIAAVMTLEATAEEIIETVHPHPTVSEAVSEAFMAAYRQAIHSL